jgi:hypothetical protein
MTLPTHPLLPKLRQLKLSGMLNTLDLRAEQAVQEQLSPLEFFALFLDDGLERRDQNRSAFRLATPGCNPAKTLAHFDFSAAPGVNHAFITDLATCAFIRRQGNVLFCGPTGVGEAHLTNALGIEALKRNLKVLSKRPCRCSPSSTPPAPTAPTTAISPRCCASTCSSSTTSARSPYPSARCRTSTRSSASAARPARS